ncbi:MAG: GNAT family N-acetyltransferase [Saprospiraceae bacterium]|nr:GNAT family N-acetyltransferase [Saprospiraceae bacterium]
MIQISKDKADYDAIVNTHYLPIFYQPAWLDLVCGQSHWEVILAFWGNDPVAVFPYYTVNKYGIKQIRMPPLTPYLGLFLIGHFDGLKTHTQLSTKKQIYKKVTENLPDVFYRTFSFHYQIVNWQPFYWEGFKQTTLYTSILSDLSDVDAVFQNFSRNVRRNIRKAENTLVVSTLTSPDKIIPVIRESEKSRGFSMQLSDDFLEKLISLLTTRGWGTVFAAIDHEDIIHSIAVLPWDQKSSYYLINANTREAENSGAGFLLTWEAIKHTSEQSINTFDFCGSMLESIQDVRIQFGAQPVARSKIFKFKYRLFNVLRY